MFDPDTGVLDIPTAQVFVPLLQPADYKGAWGGRAAAKSHFFAEKLIDDALYQRGLLSCCIREVQKSLRDSSKRLLEGKLNKLGVMDEGFKVYKDVIETPGDGVIIFSGMQDHTADSIKSLEGFNRFWWDEAQRASEYSLTILRPTMRSDGGEMWFSWNPGDEESPIDKLLRGPHAKELGAVVVNANFDDNPWLPERSAKEEAYDRAHRPPEEYAHIWRGAYLVRSERRVFKNWKRATFTIADGHQPTFRFGADFGFSVDPSVCVRIFLGRWLNNDPNSGIAVPDDAGRVLFFDREAYRVGCDVDHTPALFAGDCPFAPDDPRAWKNPYGDEGIDGALDWPMVADTARPETISYLQRHGFQKIVAAKKGPGSLQEGVEFLKSYDIVVHADNCPHVADEFTFYSFKVDKLTGKVLPVLEDKKNHTIDAARYAVEDIRRSRPTFF